MDVDSKNKTQDILTKSENILVVVAKSLGSDGLASGLALYLSLVKLGKYVTVIAQSPSVADAQRLYAVDKIGQLQNSKNPIVVIDDAVNTVDKVTYFLDGNRLKVVIHPLSGSGGIDKNQISIEYTAGQVNLIFVLGINSIEELHRELTQEQIISPETWIVNINNRQTNQNFAQINYIDQQASSISEVTAKMIQELALPIDEDISYNLYSALTDSTKGFKPVLTNITTLEVASWLLKFGAGRASLATGQLKRPDITQIPNQPQFPKAEPSSFPPKSPTSAESVINHKIRTIQELEGLESPPPVAKNSQDWLKPPKIYKGAKSFDKEN